MIRAAFTAALSFLVLPAFSQTKLSKSETYKDIIEKAYNLSLQRDRTQALNILSSAIRKENRPQAVSELKKTVKEVSNIFFSDKSQQLFETGVSLRRTDLNQSLDKVSEAARIEPDNFQIVIEMARLMIAKGDCKAGLETVKKQLSVVPFDEDLKLTQAQALACQSKWSEYQVVYDSVAVKKSPLQEYWYSLEVQKFLDQNNLQKTHESLSLLKKSDDKFPESYYWQWKVPFSQKRMNVELAQKYVMTCKNISANQYRQYMIDPMLCRRVTEVEAELKGMNGSAE